MDRQTFARSFSQPVGSGGLYPRPPYLYRGVEDCFVVYEADPEGVAALLPPGVSAADKVPTCIAWARWVPFSTFGPYHEAYLMIRASLDDETYLYQPFIFTDNEVPLAAGREIWGFAKKLAVLRRHWGGSQSPYGEQMLFTVQRPLGLPIMTVSMTCDRIADPALLDDYPVLSTRLIPNCEEDKPPSVAELVRLDVAATVHKAPDGSPKLWEGRASLAMPTVSTVDPWHLLAPRRVVAAYFGVYDFDLGYGRVVHDYLDAR
jgi:acetoacetate decarboxylase